MDIRKIKDKDLRELALKRKEEQNGTSFDLLGHKCFWWKDTPEGFDFWNKVFNDEVKKMEEKPMDKKKPTLEQVNEWIAIIADEYKAQWIQKNIDYNNSLYDIDNIFDQDPVEGLKSRISDKYNRIKAVGLNDKTEDSMGDMFGYWIHKIIRERFL